MTIALMAGSRTFSSVATRFIISASVFVHFALFIVHCPRSLMNFDPQWVRSHFPSLQSDTIFLDNPAGTQVTQSVMDAITEYFLTSNANSGGVFPRSERNDELEHQARVAFADFFNAPSAGEIIFGANMTTLTFSISRALGRWLHPDDEIIV